jgi:hypothetical protein
MSEVIARFPFVASRNAQGEMALRPLLPVTLRNGETSKTVSALLDTGADVNVLPYELGIELGCQWDTARTGLSLSGNLADFEARGVLLTCTVDPLSPTQLAFAWTTNRQVPLILGQVNFFAEFDVCFLRSNNLIEICPKRDA